MIVTSSHTKACFDAWMNCEDLLVDLSRVHNSFSKQLTKVIDECAMICMTTFHALKTKSVNTSRYAMLCIGICEECADLCEELQDDGFKKCAVVCRHCSETISSLTLTNLQ